MVAYLIKLLIAIIALIAIGLTSRPCEARGWTLPLHEPVVFVEYADTYVPRVYIVGRWLSPVYITSTLERRLPELLACGQMPVPGTTKRNVIAVPFELHIDRHGVVTHAVMLVRGDHQLRASAFESCMLDALRRTPFPISRGKGVKVLFYYDNRMQAIDDRISLPHVALVTPKNRRRFSMN